MSEQRTIIQIRNYTRLATRFHRSYAEQVHTLLGMRNKQIRATFTDPKLAQLAWTKTLEFAEREYGKVDPSFTVEQDMKDVGILLSGG